MNEGEKVKVNPRLMICINCWWEGSEDELVKVGDDDSGMCPNCNLRETVHERSDWDEQKEKMEVKGAEDAIQFACRRSVVSQHPMGERGIMVTLYDVDLTGAFDSDINKLLNAIGEERIKTWLQSRINEEGNDPSLRTC